MRTDKQGHEAPKVCFVTRENDQWVNIDSDALFKGKKVILFALPGAFTPTCSSAHLPRYNELAPAFRKEGIDEIVCLAVNDGFVMEAWKADQRADNIRFIADGNGAFSEAMGMLVDKSELGFGKRTWRYSMLVVDGVIDKMFIEPDEPGDPFRVSDADTMMDYLNPDAGRPDRVSLFTKPGCPHCQRARQLLDERQIRYEEIKLGGAGLSYATLAAVTGERTTPQVYINGERIGGAEELEKRLVR